MRSFSRWIMIIEKNPDVHPGSFRMSRCSRIDAYIRTTSMPNTKFNNIGIRRFARKTNNIIKRTLMIGRPKRSQNVAPNF